jgi:chromosome segregation ATPase
MTRSTRILASILAVVVLLGMAGCDQTKDANAAIEAANAKAAEYTALDEAISTLMDEASSVSMTPEGVKPGIEALDAATAKFEERKVIIAAVKAEFEKISAYKVSDAKKTYAKQQVEIADLLGKMDGLGIQLIADTKALYQLIESGSTDAAKAEELSAAIEATSQQLTELDASVTEKENASDTYFTDQGLGK